MRGVGFFYSISYKNMIIKNNKTALIYILVLNIIIVFICLLAELLNNLIQ